MKSSGSDLSGLNGRIVLKSSSTELSEVTVTARAESLQHKAGKFIFDPTDLIKNMPTTYDVLEFTPLLEVSQNSFSILGKGQSVVYINGRSTNMSSEALVDMLKTLPSSRIKSIEIITALGASHSASMSGGIINIIMRRPTDGYLGSAGLQLNYYNERVSPTVSSWNSYTTGKLNLSASVSYRGYGNAEKATSGYEYPDENLGIINQTNSSYWGNVVNANLRASYFLTEKSELGINLSIGSSGGHGKSIIESLETRNGVETHDKSRIDTRKPWHRPSYSVNAYYTLKTDDRGSNLDVTLGYGNSLSKSQIDYQFTADPDFESQEVKSNGISFRPKYELVISDNHSVNAGYEISRSKIDNDFIHEPASNRFIYKEMINSGYAEWNAQWSNAFSTSAGLRVEHTDITGNQVTIGDKFKQNYTDLFPSVSLSLRLPWKGNQRISLSASRGILRPYYSDLNPFVTWTSETTCEKGNIDLQPSYGWYYSMYYSFLRNFILSVSYNFSTDTKGLTINTGKVMSLY